MHISRPIPRKRINLINEDYHPSHLLTDLPHFRQLLLTFPIEFAHNGFNWDIHERDVDLLRDYFCTRSLACAWRTLEQDCFRAVWLVFHPCVLGYLVVDLRVG